ncbi:hypothetical protein LIA77_04736 [Sarocladium implicatum]|nr:hypothetical protein LIA77_04736 [Sarocladium implicatum]
MVIASDPLAISEPRSASCLPACILIGSLCHSSRVFWASMMTGLGVSTVCSRSADGQTRYPSYWQRCNVGYGQAPGKLQGGAAMSGAVGQSESLHLGAKE